MSRLLQRFFVGIAAIILLFANICATAAYTEETLAPPEWPPPEWEMEEAQEYAQEEFYEDTQEDAQEGIEHEFGMLYNTPFFEDEPEETDPDGAALHEDDPNGIEQSGESSEEAALTEEDQTASAWEEADFDSAITGEADLDYSDPVEADTNGMALYETDPNGAVEEDAGSDNIGNATWEPESDNGTESDSTQESTQTWVWVPPSELPPQEETGAELDALGEAEPDFYAPGEAEANAEAGTETDSDTETDATSDTDPDPAEDSNIFSIEEPVGETESAGSESALDDSNEAFAPIQDTAESAGSENEDNLLQAAPASRGFLSPVMLAVIAALLIAAALFIGFRHRLFGTRSSYTPNFTQLFGAQSAASGAVSSGSTLASLVDTTPGTPVRAYINTMPGLHISSLPEAAPDMPVSPLAATMPLYMAGGGVAAASIQGIGLRDSQEDSFAISDLSDSDRGVFAAVADGMGGISNGSDISGIVTSHMLQAFEMSPNRIEPTAFLLTATHSAQNKAREFIRRNGNQMSGSTLVSIIIRDEGLYFLSIGDSRLYLLRGGGLLQLNREHIFACELDERAAKGEITFEEARKDYWRGALTSYIGTEERLTIDCNRSPMKMRGGDRLLLASDGVFGTLSDAELAEAAGAYDVDEAAAAIERLIASKQREDQDNYTAIIIAFR